MQYATYASPLGTIYLTADAEGLTRLTFRKTEEFSEPAKDLSAFAPVLQWLDGYFAGSPVSPAFPMNPKGTPFQMLIWQLLLQIPYGQTCTYGALAQEAARRMGRQSMSSQAVGQAVGRNPIAIAIPCHRVLGRTGSLTGYAEGLEKKQWLLEHEGFVKFSGRG